MSASHAAPTKWPPRHGGYRPVERSRTEEFNKGRTESLPKPPAGKGGGSSKEAK